ncbi:hypothetical protein ABIB86_000415 [Bradyrhizobium sp. JR1.7]|uniref:hypothetical protein n=1 Tax=unclassified Bradyrhizobium TaxID=2631580 RepID=UPI003390B608
MTDASAKAIATVAIILVLVAWNGTILVGTAYIVFVLGYSGWWWLLAVVLMSGSANATEKATEKKTA